MNVSEIASAAGITPSAVRFYERKGVLPPAQRQANGYRDYGDGDLCRLRMVVSLRRLGLELPVAGRLAALCQSGECDVMAQDLLPLISAQRAAIERSRAEIDELDRQLADLEVTLQAVGIDADTCLEKGGESDELQRLRLRAELPVPAIDRMPELTTR